MPHGRGLGEVRLSLIFLLVSCTTDDGPRAVDKPAPEPVAVAPVPVPMPTASPTTAPVPTTEPVVPWDCTQARLTAAWELGSGGDQEMNLLAPMPGGDMIVVGDFSGEVDFGNGVVARASNGDELVVVRIRPDGLAVWATVLTGGPIIPQGVAVDAAGRIAVVGSFSGDLILNQGTPEEGVYHEVQGLTGFLAVLSSTGNHEWVRLVAHDGAGSESFDAVAFDAGGTLWAAGTFKDQGIVSYGQPDAVALVGDSNLNYDDAFLARYDPAGALLGLAWTTAEGPQWAHHVAVRPTGGVDWLLGHEAKPTPLTDMGGTVVELPGGPSSNTIVRFDGLGHVEDSLALATVFAAWELDYSAADLVFITKTAAPSSIPAWDESLPLELPDTGTTVFGGPVTWAGGIAPVSAELVEPYSNTTAGFVSALGKAVGARSGADINVLPDTVKLEILESDLYSDGAARPYAVAWDPTGQFVCGVDIETSEYHDVPLVVRAVALDEAGGLWLAGDYQDQIFTYESYEGGPALFSFEASNGEETQGFLARWQLWPGPASPVPVPVPAP